MENDTIPLPIQVEPGDVVACWGTDWMSRWISFWTSLIGLFRGPRGLKWSPSHVAIVGEYNGRIAWYESTSKCPHPCLVSGHQEDGFQVHEPWRRVQDYLDRGGLVRVYRPSPLAIQALDTDELERILRVVLEKNLTYSYFGAGLSGTQLLRYSRLIDSVDLVDVFCSEIVAAILQPLGLLNWRDPRHFNPGRLMRELVQTGAYRFHREYRR